MMISLALLPYLTTLFVLAPTLLAGCPPTKPANPIPGCWGEPGCAYVLAADLGPGAACQYDYCNCGGINVPLLPATIGNKTTVGCDAYTTVPTADNCPTAPASLGGSSGGGGGGSGPGGAPFPTPITLGNPISTTPDAFTPTTSNVASTTLGSSGGGGGGSGPGGEPLPTPVTTGGPISTAPDAFAATASSVTTLKYQGSALTYTRATFTSLSAQTSTITVTATVTKTASAGGAVATYVGPIVVGPQGVFWGPPGTAPDCVWPFCMGSGPPAGGNGDGDDANGGGGTGGSFGCQDCLGGGGLNGQGGGSNGGGNNGGGGGGTGSGGGGGDDGGSEGGNGEPPPEACPGAKRIKRSDSSTSTSGRIIKRGEEQFTSANPLKDALNNFGKDKQGNGLASTALDTAEGILTNKFPAGKQNAYVTGLEGHYTLTQKLTVGTGDNQQTFASGTRLFWRVRWDYDPAKGPHVNAQFGTKSSTKFAYQLDSSKFTDPVPGKTMNGIMQNLNKQCNYNTAINLGKDQPTWDSTEHQALEDLKKYFKSVVNEPC